MTRAQLNNSSSVCFRAQTLLSPSCHLSVRQGDSGVTQAGPRGVSHPSPAAAQLVRGLGGWHLLAPAGTSPGPGSGKGLRAKPKEEISQTNISFFSKPQRSFVWQWQGWLWIPLLYYQFKYMCHRPTNTTHLSKLPSHKSGVRYTSNEPESGMDQNISAQVSPWANWGDKVVSSGTLRFSNLMENSQLEQANVNCKKSK